MIPIIVLFAVFALIAVRRVGGIRLQIWQVMLGGAVAVLLTGQISPIDAALAINLDVILFLFGMFVVGEGLERSGYLSHLSYKVFRRAKTADRLVLMILFVMGFASAFLMNDTLAIIGTPVVLLLAKKHAMSPKVLLLALAFAVTIGSVMSPIGNPQNLLIAIGGGIENPFLSFFGYLLIPTVINLLLCYVLLKLFYKGEFHKNELAHTQEPIRDKQMAKLAKASLVLILAMVAAKIAFVFIAPGLDFRLTYIALVAAAPLLLFSGKRAEIARNIDWSTLVFFAAMFVLMASVWQSGFFQSVLAGSHADITSLAMIFLVSILLSQVISNVPLVALYLPMLVHAGASAKGMLGLAAGSTIAGNLLILGAASNVIIIQNAEKKHGETLGFLEFAKVGIPLTAVNAVVYWGFLLAV